MKASGFISYPKVGTHGLSDSINKFFELTNTIFLEQISTLSVFFKYVGFNKKT